MTSGRCAAIPRYASSSFSATPFSSFLLWLRMKTYMRTSLQSGPLPPPFFHSCIVAAIRLLSVVGALRPLHTTKWVVSLVLAYVYVYDVVVGFVC